MTDKTTYRPGEPTWIDLGSHDMEAAITFYRALFGWTVARGGEELGGYSMFLQDGKQVGGVGPHMAASQPPSWSTYLSVEDIDKTATLVQDNGGQILMDPMQVMEFGRMAVFADPSGAAISAWQPQQHHGAELRDVEGTLIWNDLTSRDQDAAIAFYQAVFGWRAHQSDDYTEFRLGGDAVAGCMAMPDSVPAEVPSYWLPYFAAADPAAKAQQVGELGGTILLPFLDFGTGCCSIVADPQGAAFGLLTLSQL